MSREYRIMTGNIFTHTYVFGNFGDWLPETRESSLHPCLLIKLGMDHYFLLAGGYPFHKKICSLAEKNCLLQGYELKKIVCKAKGNFLEYIDISKF